ncbi:hypothetical protein AMAG_05772 [Allomyces macrogynus ATCC 38327]|uniref:F-box domain-containing protein n=1 Tax=Allomyces macrogynus (strain ATCC 38327) TaxID=578462 RepID=A0A0L0SCW6_ALLM3|nr:hypothetical protein AMAG_05772 [Allomyces macrogynus ATCC 38327]|eukprot:KNE60383.1 hypothetical protein AMAG_05772 [Allomyces macrogynus ATCC 38327]
MTTPNLLQPHQSAATLDRMPPFVLIRIATGLLDGEPYRVPLLHLALASPSLFAPCLRVAIKTTGARGPSTRYQISLCLLPRGADRAILPPRDKLVRGRDHTVEWSRKWSLLPVSIDQLFQYTVDESHIIAAVYAVSALVLESKKINWRSVSSLPLSLVELRPVEIPAPVVGGGAHGAVFAQLFPHGLRKLTLTNTLELLWPESAGSGPFATKDARLAVARSVSSLQSLRLFVLKCHGVHDLHQVPSALPRSTLRKLDLVHVMGKDETDEMLLQLASSWPDVIESLSLSVNCDCTDRAAADVLSLVTKLPVVMRALFIKVPQRDVVLCQKLLVTSSLERLKFDSVDLDLMHLADLFTSLPKSLTHMDLLRWWITLKCLWPSRNASLQ